MQRWGSRRGSDLPKARDGIHVRAGIQTRELQAPSPDKGSVIFMQTFIFAITFQLLEGDNLSKLLLSEQLKMYLWELLSYRTSIVVRGQTGLWEKFAIWTVATGGKRYLIINFEERQTEVSFLNSLSHERKITGSLSASILRSVLRLWRFVTHSPYYQANILEKISWYFSSDYICI